MRTLRAQQGLSQEALANKCGLHRTYISSVERCSRNIGIDNLQRIADALSTPVAAFFPGDSETAGGSRSNADHPTDPSERRTSPESRIDVGFFKDASVYDYEWTEDDWKRLLNYLVNVGLVNFKEIAALVLGHLNPSQVGTSIASKPTFQANYPKRKTMQAVYAWHNEQSGHCADCQTRLELQADHIEPRQHYGDAADRLENMTLRCRRCNVVRRDSHHKHGGKTFLTTESALMWILLVQRPSTYQEFDKICRDYGLTMANVRFKEAWAMAHWLSREGKYYIDPSSTF